MRRGSRGYEAGEVCNDLAHIFGDNPLPCHHSGRFFSLIPLGHYNLGRDDILPVVAPPTTATTQDAGTQFEGDPVGGPSASGK